MASTTETTTFAAAPFTNFVQGLVRFAERLGDRQGRRAQVEALYAKSDAELADIGLTRDQIARRVFGDLYYI